MMAAALFIAGVFAWTLVEYLLHRFAFHTRNRLLGRRHLAHHARMNDRSLALAPPASILGGSALAALVSFGALGLRGGWLFGGFLAGYVAYELTHFALHYRRAKSPVGRALQRHHLAHHQRTPRARFGVTSPLWDFVFGTAR